MAKKRPVSLTIPSTPEWVQNLRNASVKTGFTMSLTKPMLDFLCATSDDVQWDRALYFQTNGAACPDNWFASSHALIKRGLIECKSQEEIKAESRDYRRVTCEWSNYRLTPAGELIVSLIKMAGLFVEADTAINKRSRRA